MNRVPYIRNMRCYPDNTFNIGRLYVERNSIDENPTYQRESAIWSLEKKQLFIDSLLNNYDIPKIYFHDLRGESKLKNFSIIDGKQRLYTIYEFMQPDGFSLADDFELNTDSTFTEIKKSDTYKSFSPTDKERFKSISLPIVLIQNATEEDIEDLFFRLNNGEPLNGAEKRNARGGDTNILIRELASNEFFTKKLRFANKRYSHLEVSAKLLLLEKTEMDTKEVFSDLKKKYLDNLVVTNKRLDEAVKEGLAKRVIKNLNVINKIFNDNDPLLNKQSLPPLYYIFTKVIVADYGHDKLYTFIRKFLEGFEVKRQKNLLLIDDDRDSTLIEYGRLMQQGTNDISSLKNRVSILKRYFLMSFPDVKIKDEKRLFTNEERYAIYVMAGKQCDECKKDLNDISDMEADHIDQHIFGGETTLKNARALCIDCNQKLKKRVK